MTPLSKARPQRSENSVWKMVAFASFCSAILSASVTWAVMQNYVTKPKPVIVVAAEKPTPRNAPPMVEQVVVPPQEGVAVELIQAPVVADATPLAIIGSTAENAYNVARALHDQYYTTAYFSNRGTLKGYLDGIEGNARQLQEMIASGASPEELSAKTLSLETSLDRAISRLDYLVTDKSNQKNIDEAGVSAAIKAKLEEMRATLP